VLAVPANHQVRTPVGRNATVAALARLVPARCWETRSCGRGRKGHRDYEWALVATSRRGDAVRPARARHVS